MRKEKTSVRAGLAFLVLVLLLGARADDEASVVTEEVVEESVAAEEIVYMSPVTDPLVFFAEHFDDPDVVHKKWIKSLAAKGSGEPAGSKYDGEWSVEPLKQHALTGDRGLVLKSKAKHAAISAHLKKPFKFDQESLIVQYEINFQNGQECGGGYIKLLNQENEALDLNTFHDKTPYSIMFGPDKCGSDSKLHFIFRHVNPKNGSIEEKHCKKLETRDRAAFEESFKDQRPHLYRLVLNPDNTYEISIDYKIINHGNLLTDFTPPVNPPAEIDDPDDFKPEHWDEREKIPDPAAKKPDDWDEMQPRQIPDTSAVKPEGWLDNVETEIHDPTATKPDDWDEEMDGEWEAPLVPNPLCDDAPGCGTWKPSLIDNPLYKGKWAPPLIENPAYRGKWKPRRIPNPHYFHDPMPYKLKAIHGVGIELWSMSDSIYFDNILITHQASIADAWSKDTFDLKLQRFNANNTNIFGRIMSYSNKNPWLYAVYVVVIGLPLVLIITFCCSGGDSKSDKSDPKKTDDIVEDDEEEVEEDENGASQEEVPEETLESSKGPTTRKRKARKE